jgi:predicted transposase/invertase (TIGR01784 family)
MKLIILELPKLPEAATVDKAVWPWLKFLKSTQEEEYEMLALKYPELEKPVFCAKKMSLIEKWRDIQFHKNLWKVDERNLFEQARIDGHAQGVAEGREEGRQQSMKEKLEIARNALAKGLSVELVHEITGLDIETIQHLLST